MLDFCGLNFFKKLKITALFIVFVVFFVGKIFAQESPDDLVLEVNPSSFDVNQPVDITIKAVKSNGEVVKDYDGEIMIDIPDLSQDDYVLPADGLYEFTPQDQGVKTFSKGLIIKKKGNWTVEVSDIFNPDLSDQVTVVVGNPNSGENIATNEINIQILSPESGSVVTTQVINVLANAEKYPNSRYQIYLNGKPVKEGFTDGQGQISDYISGLVLGKNTLKVQVIDINSNPIGLSNEISFEYKSKTDNIFKGIDITPSEDLMQGDKITVKVLTADGVGSVEMVLSNGISSLSFPMDSSAPGIFSKQITLSQSGNVNIDLKLIVGGNTKIYTGVAVISVKEKITVVNIKYVKQSDGSIKVSWKSLGNVDSFLVKYGVDPNVLNITKTVKQPEIILSGLQQDIKYYLQIQPLGPDQQAIGIPSNIIEINPLHPAGGEQGYNCVVKDIQVNSAKIGTKHYLYWDAVSGAVKYIIYKSQRETTDYAKLTKVGETTDTKFEYPFDYNATKNEYEYFVVEAICDDGSKVFIDKAKKVQVGPEDNILFAIALTLFLFTLYKLNFISTRE